MAAARLSHSYAIAVLACIFIFSNGVEGAHPANTTSNHGESTSTTTSASTCTAASVPSNTVTSASAPLTTCTSPTESSCISSGSTSTAVPSVTLTFALAPITPRTLASSSPGINPVASRSLSKRDGNTSENSSRSSSSSTTDFRSPTTFTSTTSIKSSPRTKFNLLTGASSMVTTVSRIKHSRGTTTTTFSHSGFSSTTSSSPTFLATPSESSTYVLSDIPATSADLSSIPTSSPAVAKSSSSPFWNNGAIIAAFVITTLIAMVVISVCLFAVFKRCDARRQFLCESFTDVFPHSRGPSSMTAQGSISQKDSSNFPRDVPRLSLFSFPVSIRQSKRASTPSIKSFFSPTPQPQLSSMTTPFQQEMGSSTIPDVLPDIPFSFSYWTPKRESPDSFFGGPVLQPQPF